jgi:hypothetical protein
MSIELVGANFVATVAVPEEGVLAGDSGLAGGRRFRPIARYLAHFLFGDWVGSAYDVITVLILATAGASAMAGLLNISPRFLPPVRDVADVARVPAPWSCITLVCLIVTYIFGADVEGAGGATRQASSCS